MRTRNAVRLAGAVLCSAVLTTAQGPEPFKVRIRYNEAPNRSMVNKDAELLIDQQTGKLEVRHKERPLSVAFKDVEKVVFEVSHHMRGGSLLSNFSESMLLGTTESLRLVAGGVEDDWCLVMSKDPTGVVVPYLMEIRKEDVPKVVTTVNALLGDRVVLTQFQEKEAKVEKDTLKDVKTKHSMDRDEVNRPIPEIKPDKALVVVVCPSFPTGGRSEPKLMQQKLHANDKVVAINKMGTYSFCYLDPGEYRLISQAANASGFTMHLEAGKDYYFFQNSYVTTGLIIKVATSLSRQSKELAMYELNGSYYSVWKEK